MLSFSTCSLKTQDGFLSLVHPKAETVEEHETEAGVKRRASSILA